MMAARPCADAVLPTPAFASPQPTSPPSVSTFTMTESNDAMRPKSLVCCRSYGIGTWTQVARTLVIFIGAFSYRADEALSRRLGGRPEGCYTTRRNGCRGPRNGRIAHVEGPESRARRSGRRRPRRRVARPRADHAHDVLVGVPPAPHHGRRPAGMGERGREGDARPRQVPDAAQASLGAARDVRRGPGGAGGPVGRDCELHARAAHPADARGAARRGRDRARQLGRLLAHPLEALPQDRRVQGREAARRVHPRPRPAVHQAAGQRHRRHPGAQDPDRRRRGRGGGQGARRLRVREAGARVLRAAEGGRRRRRVLPDGVHHLVQARHSAGAGDAVPGRDVQLVVRLLHERGQVEQIAEAGPGGGREDLRRVDRASRRAILGVAASAVLLAMMFLTFVDVVARYIFSRPVRGAFEVTELMLVVLIFAGLPLVSWADEHALMDFIDRLLGARAQRLLVRAVQAACAAVMFLLAWLIWLKADRIWAYRDATDVLRVVYGPFVYFMAFILGLAGLIHLRKAVG